MIYQWGAGCRALLVAAREAGDTACAYERSILYLSQAMRRGGRCVTNPFGFGALAYDYEGTGKHALICPIAEDMVRFLCEAIKECRKNGYEIAVIKHVPDADLHRLICMGFEVRPRVTAVEAWLDDVSEDNLPQVVLDLSKTGWIEEEIAGLDLLLPSSVSLSDFRYQVRRFGRRLSSAATGRILQVRPVHDSGQGDVSRVISDWINAVGQRFLRRGWPRVRDLQECLVVPNESVIRAAMVHRDVSHGEMVFIDDVPVGLWIGESISKQCLGIYALIANTTCFNLSYLVLLLAIVSARRRGFDFLALGGSETESLFRFKSLSQGGDSEVLTERIVHDLLIDNLRSL